MYVQVYALGCQLSVGCKFRDCTKTKVLWKFSSFVIQLFPDIYAQSPVGIWHKMARLTV